MYGERRPEFDPNQFLDNLRQAWERFTSRLPGGGGSGLVVGIIAIVIVAIWLATGIYSVQPNEQASTQLFGKFTGITDPGLHWYWPGPVGKVQKVSVFETKTMELGFRSDQGITVPVEALMITGDLNIVSVQLAVQYRISNPKDYLFQVDDPGDPDRNIPQGDPDGRTLKDATEAAVRQVVGQRGIDDVLTRQKEQVQSDTAQLIQAFMDSYGTGINILSVQLQEVKPPDAVRAAFDDVVAARSDKTTRVNQADAYEQDQIPKAKGAAQQVIQAAQAFKVARVSRAQGEADKFNAILSEYDKSKEVTRQRLYLEAMEQVLASVKLFVVDGQSTTGVLPFLPLSDGSSTGTTTGSGSNTTGGGS